MGIDSPNRSDKLIPISEAARILGVSMVTVRRWDEKDILHSTRLGGRYRYFMLEELEAVRSSRPLSISAAAQQTGVSAKTLKRLENEGLIQPEYMENGWRQYSRRSLEDFINSEYFLSRNKVREKVLESFNQDREEGTSAVAGQRRRFSTWAWLRRWGSSLMAGFLFLLGGSL